LFFDIPGISWLPKRRHLTETSMELAGALVSNLRAHKFVHGNAQVDGRIVLFFYFEDADTGMAMIIPGIRGQGEMARFHLTGGLADPQKN
jgi:hypothetical protein